MEQFTFWHRWLLVVSIVSALNGLVVCWWPDSPHLAPWNRAIETTVAGGAASADVRRFLLGPLGATMAGYFVLQTFLVAGPLRRGERWAWQALVAGLLTWFLADSARSLRVGAVFNIWMVNLPTLLLAGVPLIFLRGKR